MTPYLFCFLRTDSGEVVPQLSSQSILLLQVNFFMREVLDSYREITDLNSIEHKVLNIILGSKSEDLKEYEAANNG